ncbi:unnamed protein product [Boreogadus saida]
MSLGCHDFARTWRSSNVAKICRGNVAMQRGRVFQPHVSIDNVKTYVEATSPPVANSPFALCSSSGDNNTSVVMASKQLRLGLFVYFSHLAVAVCRRNCGLATVGSCTYVITSISTVAAHTSTPFPSGQIGLACPDSLADFSTVRCENGHGQMA